MNTVQLDPVLVRKLADAFVADLRASLTSAEWHEMRRRNAAETSRTICHSHDFLDANMNMEAAFRQVMGRIPEGSEPAPEVYADPDLTDADIWVIEAKAREMHERDTALWNAAWEMAMPSLTAGSGPLDRNAAWFTSTWSDLADRWPGATDEQMSAAADELADELGAALNSIVDNYRRYSDFD